MLQQIQIYPDFPADITWKPGIPDSDPKNMKGYRFDTWPKQLNRLSRTELQLDGMEIREVQLWASP